MKIYLDDDLDSNTLIQLLQQAGHEVTSPRAAGTRGAADGQHLAYAAAHGLVVFTANARDYIDLHNEWTATQRQHHGIVIVYRENSPRRDMSFPEIARAVTEMERSALPLANAFHNLSFYRRHGD